MVWRRGVYAMIRHRLPTRRGAETCDFEHAGHRFAMTVGYFRDGRPAEIFLSSRHVGSPLEAIARDAAVVTSIALQHGADLDTIRAALTKDQIAARQLCLEAPSIA